MVENDGLETIDPITRVATRPGSGFLNREKQEEVAESLARTRPLTAGKGNETFLVEEIGIKLKQMKVIADSMKLHENPVTVRTAVPIGKAPVVTIPKVVEIRYPEPKTTCRKVDYLGVLEHVSMLETRSFKGSVDLMKADEWRGHA